MGAEIIVSDYMPDECSGDAYAFIFSPDDEGEPVVTITRAVAWLQQVRVTELAPLNDVVDVDALSRLVAGGRPACNPGSAAAENSLVEVSFRYEGCQVTVDSSVIHVEAID